MRPLPLACLLLLSCAAAVMPCARAQTGEVIERFVEREAGVAAAQIAGARIEVEVGRLDPRLQLAQCSSIEPFLPAGTRLWGRAQVGLRCNDKGPAATRWQVFLPVTVKVLGPALVAARPLAAGQAIGIADLVTAEVDWTRESQGVLTDASQLEGRVTARPIAAGQPIPLAALRVPQVLTAGDQVRVIGRGAGFSVTAQAVAMAAAQDGQAVRVRLESGRILTGTARAGRIVDVSF